MGAALIGHEPGLLHCAAASRGLFNASYVVFLLFGPKLLESLDQSAVAAAGAICIASWIMIVSTKTQTCRFCAISRTDPFQNF